MSSWPPHLPIAITASRAEAAASPDPRPGDGQRRRRACRRRGRTSSAAASSTPRWWARSRAASRSSSRRYSTRSASTRLARPAAVATGSGRRRVGADGARAAPPRTAYAAGRVRAERRVGQLAPVLGVAAPGGRPAPALAPSTREQPHRGALVVGERRRAARRAGRRPASASRDQPGRAARSGSAVRPSSAQQRLGGVAELRRCPRGRGSGSLEAEPEQVARGWSAVRVIGGPAHASANRAASGRQRVVELVARRRRSRRARRPASRPARAWSLAVGVGPGRDARSASTSGWCWTPQTVGREAGHLHLAAGGLRRARPRRRAASVTTSSFHCTPRRGVASRAEAAGRRRASAVQPTSSRPTCWPRGLRRRPRRRGPPRPAGGPGRCPSVGTPSATRVADQLLDRAEPRRCRRRRWRPSRRRAPPARRTPSRVGQRVAGVRAADLERAARPRRASRRRGRRAVASCSTTGSRRSRLRSRIAQERSRPDQPSVSRQAGQHRTAERHRVTTWRQPGVPSVGPRAEQQAASTWIAASPSPSATR